MYLMKYAHRNLLEVETKFFKKYSKTMCILTRITKYMKQLLTHLMNNNNK